MNNIVKDSFVVVSDFHANRWPFEKIKNYYLNEYDKIFILGDATDRGEDGFGTGGIQLLLDIKELTEKYPDRVFYVPGNHDDFVYDLIVNDSESAKINMKMNGGDYTYRDIKSMKKNNPSKINELGEWLGKQPLQRTHEFKGQKYALAHALFNKKIYDKNKNFALKDFNRQERLSSEQNIIWFRKAKNRYDVSSIPSDEYIMVIGHTPEPYRKGLNLNLVNDNGETVKVICVDGGIAYKKSMLKYDGGPYEVETLTMEHNDTSPKYNHIPAKVKEKTIKEKNQNKIDFHKEMLNKVIIEGLKNNSSIYGITNAVLYGNIDGLPYDTQIRKIARTIAEQSIRTIIEDIAIEHPEYLEKNMNSDVLLHNYICEVALNHVIDSLLEYYNNTNNPTRKTISQIYGYLETGDSSYITRQVGNARNVISNIGTDAINKIIGLNGCMSIEAYTNKYIITKKKIK